MQKIGSVTSSGQTICLCMIVKDEAPVICRCLDAVRPLVDSWLIVDTGSTDGTQDIIRAHLADLPGELVERPWRDFAANRSEALALARPRADYALIVDADDVFEIPAGFRLPALDADSYTVEIAFDGYRYRRPQLVRAALPWRYEGVIHEFLACEDARTNGDLPLRIHVHDDGARRRDPETSRRDVAVLERALANETSPFLRSRYQFYLARTYRDCGEFAKAAEAYLARAEMGHWPQEIYVSLYEAGGMMEILGRDRAAVLAIYERASATCRTRAEALHAASRLCRLSEDYARGLAYARQGLGIVPPTDGLLVQPWIYAYGLLDELAVNAYWTGAYRDSLDASLRALEAGTASPDDQRRLARNARFAAEKLLPPGAG